MVNLDKAIFIEILQQFAGTWEKMTDIIFNQQELKTAKERASGLLVCTAEMLDLGSGGEDISEMLTQGHGKG